MLPYLDYIMHGFLLREFGFLLREFEFSFLEFRELLIINPFAFQRKIKAFLMKGNSLLELGFPWAANGNPFVEFGFFLATQTKLRSNINC